MASDPNRPEPLLSVPNEFEAAAIVTALADYGIEAITTGGYDVFNAGAMSDVAILVKQADLDRAKRALAEIRTEHASPGEARDDLPRPQASARAAKFALFISFVLIQRRRRMAFLFRRSSNRSAHCNRCGRIIHRHHGSCSFGRVSGVATSIHS